MGLTAKQQVFIDHYLTCWNATEAALKAGYSARSARQIASENLTKPDIANAIRARLVDLTMSADEVLVRMTAVGRGSMEDFTTLDDAGRMTWDFKKARDAGKLHLIKKFKVTTRTMGPLREVTEELELYDAQQARQLMGKHHRLFADRLEVDWRKELEAAGLDPEATVDTLADEFEALIRQRAAEAHAGGVGEGEGTA